MNRLLPLVALVSLVAAACGSPGVLPLVTSDDDAAILRVEDVGGFVPIEYTISQGPRYVLSGGRELISLGPQIMIYPGPMLPNYQTVQLGEDDLDLILEAVVATGLPGFEEKRDTTASSFVADAATTVVTFSDSQGDHVFAVYALGISEFADPQVQALEDLIALLDELAVSGPSADYETDRVQVVAREGEPEEPDFAVVKPWPVEPTPGEFEQPVEGVGCEVFEGAEGEMLLDEFGQSHQLTYFEADETTYWVLPRPLLPGESGCVVSVA
ncbi:MAG TPA: hypothetical protein VIL12_07000 [Acidimicrobiia bacterium]